MFEELPRVPMLVQKSSRSRKKLFKSHLIVVSQKDSKLRHDSLKAEQKNH
jgi:hypothetical protein